MKYWIAMVDKVSHIEESKQVKASASFVKEIPQNTFAEILKEKGVKLSGHAIKMMETRNILPNEDIGSKLCSAIEKAKSKGSRECLVLMGDIAYLISVKNNTVITLVNKDELKERIFTQIDSVVIL